MPFIQAVNTTASVWRNGQADTVQLDGHEALLRSLVTWLADKPTFTVGYVGTGNGTVNYLDGGVAGLSEAWTVTLTGGGTTFTVSGATSGAQASGTVGTNYTTSGSTLTSNISFLLEQGGTAFINGDVFTFTATANTIAAADVWVLDSWSNFDLFTDQVGGGLWWHGEGDGTQAIYCGIRLETNAGSVIWNWIQRAATGFSGSQTWSVQPGISPEYYSAFWDDDMLYWMIGSGRRYSVAAKVSTTFHAMYQGLFLPFGSPTEYPLPLCNLGESNLLTAWNSVASTFNNFPLPQTSGGVRDVGGTWLIASDSSALTSIQLWPACNAGFLVEGMWDNHENFNNGDHQLFPVMLFQGPAAGKFQPLGMDTYGVLDGVRRVTGFGNSAETILTISAVDHVVFQNIFRTTRQDYWAMEMA